LSWLIAVNVERFMSQDDCAAYAGSLEASRASSARARRATPVVKSGDGMISHPSDRRIPRAAQLQRALPDHAEGHRRNFLSRVWESDTGFAFNYPLIDDTGAAAAVVAEATASNAGPDVNFAAIAFDATPTWRSGLVTASVELAQDSAFNFENLLASIGGVRIARGAGAAAAIVGVTAASTRPRPQLPRSRRLPDLLTDALSRRVADGWVTERR
jgi:hypothetical protein